MFKDEDLSGLPERVRLKLGLMIAGLLTVALALVGVAIYLFAPWKDVVKPVPSPSPQLLPTPTLSPQEELFVSVMRERPAFATESDIKLVETGEAVCTAFDTGASTLKIREVVVDSGVAEYDAGWLIGASVRVLCPQHISKVE